MTLSGKTVFLTGGAGFIGSTIAGLLLEQGNRIVVYDSFRRDSISDRPWRNHPDLRIIRGDVTDAAALQAAMLETQPELVAHLAAIAGVDTVLRSPTATMRVNLTGTINALEAAQKLSNLERFIDFSTSEVFGSFAYRAEETQTTSVGAVGEARWIYAVSKLAGEHLVHAYHREFNMPTVTVRPFNVYGPAQTGEGAIHRFVTEALRGNDLEIHGDGTQIRAWCYVDDMVEGVLRAMEHPKAIGESFNIGNAREVVTIYALATTIVRVLGSKSKIRFVRKDHADVELRVPNVDKARRLIDFEAKIDLEEGIRRTGDYYRTLMQ
ncbi:MAG TPA: SDR family NAD(P)-dependent oxidoreductase [Thermoanaerobaculia bacterium]|jgi:UDP-glucose 4-epimerase